jgi:hypothetical protein
MNLGEQICGDWLRHVKGCDFVQFNVRTVAVQGEIDVLGIDMRKRQVFACEVAVHLRTGLRYTGAGRGNVQVLTAKFRKDIAYLHEAFPGHEKQLMLWSPVVKSPREGAKDNQAADVREVVESIAREHGLTIDAVINEKFRAALDSLREIARKETKELDSPVMRFLQIEAATVRPA